MYKTQNLLHKNYILKLYKGERKISRSRNVRIKNENLMV